MKISMLNTPAIEVETSCLVIGVLENAPLAGPALEVDRASGGRIQAMIESGDIDPDRSYTTLIHGLEGVAAERILVVGGGVPGKFDRVRFHNACMAAARYLKQHAVTEAHVCLNAWECEDLDEAWRLRQTIVAFDQASYRYITTKPLKKDDPRPLSEASFQGDDTLEEAFEQARGMCAGIRMAKELGNLPPNICNPGYLAEQAMDIARRHDSCEVEILGEAEMTELGMEALLSVGRGSANESKLIILRHNGGAEGEKPYVLVGKGVTFDSGGISLKPGPHMDEMKFDMCGAATVIGTFEAAAQMNVGVNLITVVAAVENMPDGDAYRPGDVLTSMSGKTIEILNTDAEGRLALCDALTYSERFDPAAIIDVATLTGACVIALGHHASAVMTKHDDLASELVSAGSTAVDRAWPLPLWEDYNVQLKSPFADMKNVGGMPAGAITAGCFLSKFAKDMRWAHVDIAGSAWKWNGNEGATGRPVGMLSQFLIDRAG